VTVAGRRFKRSVMFVVLCVVVVVMLFPFAYMLITSFRSYDQFLAGSGFSLDSWQGLFDELPVVQQMVNSAIVTVSAVALILFASTTAGFAFAKLRFPTSPLLFVGILAGMMIPVQSIIIPEFVNIANVGLINQYPGPILVYAALGIPFGTYLMTTYFRGVPNELLEASLMDGASYLRSSPWRSSSSSRSGATCSSASCSSTSRTCGRSRWASRRSRARASSRSR
jgi:ABC-type glycerol-3-phosphate transport system permease component